MSLPEYSQGQLGGDRVIHFGISKVGPRQRESWQSSASKLFGAPHLGLPSAARVCERVQGGGLGRSWAADSVDSFLQPEEGRTVAEAEGADTGRLGGGGRERQGLRPRRGGKVAFIPAPNTGTPGPERTQTGTHQALFWGKRRRGRGERGREGGKEGGKTGGCSSEARGGGFARVRERGPPHRGLRTVQAVVAKCGRRGFTEPGEG